MLGISDIKSGAKIVIDGDPYVVTWNQFGKTARQGGVMKTKLKNLLTGRVMEKTFQGNDKAEEADVVFKRAQFLYASGDSYDFMDQESYETITLDKATLGETVNFLSDGMDCDLQYFNDKAINVQLPAKMTFTITETDPGVQGDRVNGGTKPATIETGYVVRVPLFVNREDRIVVNTDSGEYIERAKD